MRRLRLAVVGYGKLGRACAAALHGAQDLQLAGIVVRAGAGAADISPHVPVVEHVRLLAGIDAALVCVPSAQSTGVAADLLQQRTGIVECAALEDPALHAHYEALAIAARHHHAVAVLGAGWNPGVLPLLERTFELLIPHGHTDTDDRPGTTLHHTSTAAMPGARAAVACERRSADGASQRYVYVELERGASVAEIERAIAADPVYAGVQTFVFAVPDVGELEAASSGLLLQRHGSAASGAHDSVLLEARYDVHRFAAQVMLDGARAFLHLKAGAHRYCPSMGSEP